MIFPRQNFTLLKTFKSLFFKLYPLPQPLKDEEATVVGNWLSNFQITIVLKNLQATKKDEVCFISNAVVHWNRTKNLQNTNDDNKTNSTIFWEAWKDDFCNKINILGSCEGEKTVTLNLVYNTATFKQRGTHWLAVVITFFFNAKNLQRCIVEIFDSMQTNDERNDSNDVRLDVTKMLNCFFGEKLEKTFKHVTTETPYQKDDASECGVWALFYIYLRHLGFDGDEILLGPNITENKKNWRIPFRSATAGWEKRTWEDAISNDSQNKKDRRKIFFCN